MCCIARNGSSIPLKNKGNLNTRTGYLPSTNLLCNRFSNLLSETSDKGLDKLLGFQEFEAQEYL